MGYMLMPATRAGVDESGKTATEISPIRHDLARYDAVAIYDSSSLLDIACPIAYAMGYMLMPATRAGMRAFNAFDDAIGNMLTRYVGSLVS